MLSTPEECAAALLETTPLVMRSIRAEMRRHRASGLSVTQFRSLLFIRRYPGTSLTSIAEHLDLKAPSACTLVDGLAAAGFVNRTPSTVDRRRIEIRLSESGGETLGIAEEATRAFLTRILRERSPQEIEAIHSAMRVLRAIFETPELSTGAPS
jgi:DNA-binding MarR family transcriptional regulator